jgi:hypothetical protein
MPFPSLEKQKALDKYVNDYQSGKLTKEQLNGLPYNKHFVNWIIMKSTPINGFEQINRFDTLNFFYKIIKLMNAGFMAEYDNLGIEFRSEEMFEIMRKISSICIEKSKKMEDGIFIEG